MSRPLTLSPVVLPWLMHRGLLMSLNNVKPIPVSGSLHLRFICLECPSTKCWHGLILISVCLFLNVFSSKRLFFTIHIWNNYPSPCFPLFTHNSWHYIYFQSLLLEHKLSWFRDFVFLVFCFFPYGWNSTWHIADSQLIINWTNI